MHRELKRKNGARFIPKKLDKKRIMWTNTCKFFKYAQLDTMLIGKIDKNFKGSLVSGVLAFFPGSIDQTGQLNLFD